MFLKMFTKTTATTLIPVFMSCNPKTEATKCMVLTQSYLNRFQKIDLSVNL